MFKKEDLMNKGTLAMEFTICVIHKNYNNARALLKVIGK
jgi:hypothetical protein